MSSPPVALHTPETLAPFTDGEWVARIRAGAVAAFETLVRHYSDKLCAFVYNSIGDRERTEELVQDLFLWIWRHRAEWEIRTGLTTYLYRSARNRAISAFRHDRLELRWKDELSRVEPPRSAATDADASADDLRAALARAIEKLPDRCRQVFLLHREHHLTYSQIAETLGIAPKTVEVHMARALMSLRTSLADWLYTPRRLAARCRAR